MTRRFQPGDLVDITIRGARVVEPDPMGPTDAVRIGFDDDTQVYSIMPCPEVTITPAAAGLATTPARRRLIAGIAAGHVYAEAGQVYQHSTGQVVTARVAELVSAGWAELGDVERLPGMRLYRLTPAGVLAFEALRAADHAAGVLAFEAQRVAEIDTDHAAEDLGEAPAGDTRVWVAIARRNVEAHQVVDDLGVTVCNRSTRTGQFATAQAAHERWGVRWCPKCWAVPPTVVTP